MGINKHSNCNIARGIKYYKCKICKKETNNYLNGIDICKECCEKENICIICGSKMKEI